MPLMTTLKNCCNFCASIGIMKASSMIALSVPFCEHERICEIIHLYRESGSCKHIISCRDCEAVVEVWWTIADPDDPQLESYYRRH